MNIHRIGLSSVVAAFLALPSITFGITLGQVDTFEDGTNQGWNGGIQLGGPAGASDHYLSIHGFGSGGNPATIRNFLNTGEQVFLGNDGVIARQNIDRNTPLGR
jgi:hypothetical protein